jgi:uncharacterized membrane protein
MGNKGWVKEESLIGQVPEAMWQAELEKSSSKYHVVAAWAAIIFDPVFAITDYLNIPHYINCTHPSESLLPPLPHYRCRSLHADFTSKCLYL